MALTVEKITVDSAFWKSKWEDKDIGFHLDKPNPLLVKHAQEMPWRPGDRILVPLCGKSLDMVWMQSRNFSVAGIELSELAVREFFRELEVKPEIRAFKTASGEEVLLHATPKGSGATSLEIFVGDLFSVTKEILGTVSGIYDRAALVALRPDQRELYVKHLMTLTKAAPTLLICYDYDQAKMEGPPFSVSDLEVRNLYQPQFKEVTKLSSSEIPGGLKGRCPALENAWRMW